MSRLKTMRKSQNKGAIRRVRCAICRMHLRNPKLLKTHYVRRHPKYQIINQVLNLGDVNMRKAMVGKKCKHKTTSLDGIHVTSSDNTVLIVNENKQENLVQVVPEDVETSTIPNNSNKKYVVIACKDNQRLKSNKKTEKLLRIGIKKVIEISKSLDERTGEFYECHCMEKSSRQSSDTESCSDSGKLFCCVYCGNGYQTQDELNRHENQHQYYCRLCSQNLTGANHREHVLQHLLRVYICHLCGVELPCIETLTEHLWYHFEQQTLENVVDMENEYDVSRFYRSSFSSSDYFTSISKILFYLTYPYNHMYSRNAFM